MKVMVIGSGGYMGRHLLTALTSHGHDVLARSSADGSGISAISGLLPDNFSIPRQTDAVVYLAQSPYFRQVPDRADHLMAVNALSAVRAAVLAREAGAKRFVYVSTGTIYAPSFDPLPEVASVRRDGWYPLSKLHGEESLNLFREDLDVIIVRPFGVYGAHQQARLVPNLIESVLGGRPITLQRRLGSDTDDGGLRISLCYIDDASRVIMHLATQGGPSLLNLAGLESPSVRELAELIGHIANRRPVFVDAPTRRDTDLIADTSLLIANFPGPFTNIRRGLEMTLDARLPSPT